MVKDKGNLMECSRSRRKICSRAVQARSLMGCVISCAVEAVLMGCADGLCEPLSVRADLKGHSDESSRRAGLG